MQTLKGHQSLKLPLYLTPLRTLLYLCSSGMIPLTHFTYSILASLYARAVLRLQEEGLISFLPLTRHMSSLQTRSRSQGSGLWEEGYCLRAQESISKYSLSRLLPHSLALVLNSSGLALLYYTGIIAYIGNTTSQYLCQIDSRGFVLFRSVLGTVTVPLLDGMNYSTNGTISGNTVNLAA